MKETATSLDQLKIIIEKFLAWDPDCKDWSFEDDPDLHDGKYPYTVITPPLLDRNNDRVHLFAQIYPCDCCNEFTVKITDAGFIAGEYKSMKMDYLFRDPLIYHFELSKFNEGADHYFDALRCAGIPIGFTKLLDRQALEKINKEYAELEKIFKKNPIKPYLGKKIKTCPDAMGNPIDLKKLKNV